MVSNGNNIDISIGKVDGGFATNSKWCQPLKSHFSANFHGDFSGSFGKIYLFSGI